MPSYCTLQVGEALETTSSAAGELGLQVQQTANTWIVSYFAKVGSTGTLPKGSGPKATDNSWNFNDWWIVQKMGDVFTMMSYTDYRSVVATEEDATADPFTLYTVDAESVPEGEELRYTDCPYYSDEIRYLEPLKVYVHSYAMVYEYEADTDEVTDAIIEKAAMRLGIAYMNELCSKNYDPDMTGEHEFESNYYIREYTDLRLRQLDSSLTQTVRELGYTFTDQPADYVVIRDGHGGAQVDFAASDNIWIAAYSYLVKTDNPLWSQGDQWIDYRECGASTSPFVIWKKGKIYSMIYSGMIIDEAYIREYSWELLGE